MFESVPVYVLNLDRCERRRNHVKRELAKFPGLLEQVVWISCVDREDFNGVYPADYHRAMAMKSIKRDMGLGEIACLWSHLRAYQDLVDSNVPWGIFLEDDVELLRDPRELMVPAMEGAAFVTGSTQSDRRREVRRELTEGVVELEVVPYGCYCYAVHRRYALEAIAHLRQGLYMPIDTYAQFRSRQEMGQTGRYWQVMGVAREAAIGKETMIGDENRWGDRLASQSLTCPPLIHQIWLGPETEPSGVWSWAVKNPARVHQLWREEQLLPIVALYGVDEIFQRFLRDGYYAGAADVARYCLLHRFGGFYADADSEALRALDIETPFLAYENEERRPGMIMNGFVQSRPNHPLWLALLAEIREHDYAPADMEPHEIWKYLGPGLLTRHSRRYGLDVLPSGLFCPLHYEHGAERDERHEPYCEHEWRSSFEIPRRNLTRTNLLQGTKN